ncbi:hypothetical protein BDF21DRAFT_399434 [Thamnidium elegans]|nr:hypothetical protein BDF21DRAFT_399434 [Thamnidium elegans]
MRLKAYFPNRVLTKPIGTDTMIKDCWLITDNPAVLRAQIPKDIAVVALIRTHIRLHGHKEKRCIRNAILLIALVNLLKILYYITQQKFLPPKARVTENIPILHKLDELIR